MSSANPQLKRAAGGVTDIISNSSIDAQNFTSTECDPRPPIAVEPRLPIAGVVKEEAPQAWEPFPDQDYPREALRNLSSPDPALRAAAAQTLGVARNPLTTAHLIAVLFDDVLEVRRAAASALIQLGDPAVPIRSLHTLLDIGCDLTISQEGGTASQFESQERGRLIGAEVGERTEDECLEEMSVDVKAQGLGDREQALVAIDSSLRDLSPLTIGDLQSGDPGKRASALLEVARGGGSQGFCVITSGFDDPSPEVRNAAALALSELEPTRVAGLFSQALETALPERCRNIGDAIVASGLAAEAIDDLGGADRDRAYNALCLLLVMAKIGAVQPLVEAIEEHESIRVRSAAVKLLSLCGRSEVAETAVKRRLRI